MIPATESTKAKGWRRLALAILAGWIVCLLVLPYALAQTSSPPLGGFEIERELLNWFRGLGIAALAGLVTQAFIVWRQSALYAARFEVHDDRFEMIEKALAEALTEIKELRKDHHALDRRVAVVEITDAIESRTTTKTAVDV